MRCVGRWNSIGWLDGLGEDIDGLLIGWLYLSMDQVDDGWLGVN